MSSSDQVLCAFCVVPYVEDTAKSLMYAGISTALTVGEATCHPRSCRPLRGCWPKLRVVVLVRAWQFGGERPET